MMAWSALEQAIAHRAPDLYKHSLAAAIKALDKSGQIDAEALKRLADLQDVRDGIGHRRARGVFPMRMTFSS